MIINKDSTKYICEIQSNFFDFILLDPPYLNVTKADWDKEEVITEEFINQLFRVAKVNCSLYLFCGLGEKSQSLFRWGPMFQQYFYFKDIITWKKSRGNGNKKGWLYTREEILWFVKENKKFHWNKEYQYSNELRKRDNKGEIKESSKGYKCRSKYKRLTNVWTDITEQTPDVIQNKHYTPKSEKLIERILKAHTKQGDTIFDPFAGSGTTEVVCNRLGLNCLSIEKDIETYNYALERIKNDNSTTSSK